jgi:hypothetical protein
LVTHSPNATQRWARRPCKHTPRISKVIDIALLRTRPDLVLHICRAKCSDVDVGELINLDTAPRRSQTRAEQLRAQQKHLDKGQDIETARALKAELQRATGEARAVQEQRDALWIRVPNLFAEDTPPGKDDADNVELRRVGNPVSADEARSHDTIGARLGIFDMARRRRSPPALDSTTGRAMVHVLLRRCFLRRPARRPRFRADAYAAVGPRANLLRHRLSTVLRQPALPHRR